ncbi:MAG: FAD-binding protein [Defluviitoga tunisiensis]|jgi:succinate dehydrogenase/fumarate reductase flavoprotein subunit|nr:FAD-binding protein [Acholeplasmataceae bacterium]HPT77435.1 FAD-binding protein [Defluviitaleaceae bacterium]HPZ29683.1 FAD-binding protein [Defluviitoga sp.]HQD63527.1 FAD-binding protein [Defluviitoga sp.]
MIKIKADAVVVGAGGAGLRAALSLKETNKNLDIKIISKGKILKDSVTATSYSDRMAFHATLDTTEPYTQDSWKYHAEDIFVIGGMVSDKNLSDVLAKNSKEAFEYLEKLGVPFSKENGKIKQFRTDGSKYARACYTGPDTAVQIAKALTREVVNQKIEVIENVMIQDILLDNENRVKGAYGLNVVTNELFIVETPAIILATGGAGQVYAENLFPIMCTGDGHAAALRAGAELVNMEFIQIGIASKKTKIACSGSFMRALPKIINDQGEDVVYKHYKKSYDSKDLMHILFSKGWSWPLSFEERSHIIDIAVQKEIMEGKKVFLDYTTNPQFMNKDTIPQDIIDWYKSSLGMDLLGEDVFSSPLLRLKKMNKEVYELLVTKGIDLDVDGKIEVAPQIQHFQGGIKINERAETCIEGLYACGEAAGGQHGANRPGGNSLLDTQVFGKIAGQNAAMYSSKRKVSEITEKEVKEIERKYSKFIFKNNKNNVKNYIRELMTQYAGVIRVSEHLERTYDMVSRISQDQILGSSINLKDYFETINIRLLSLVLLRCMNERKESRGPHLLFKNVETMELYPRDDENWAYHYIVVKLKGDEIDLEKKRVNM